MQEVQESFETSIITGFVPMYFFRKKCRMLSKSTGISQKVQAGFESMKDFPLKELNGMAATFIIVNTILHNSTRFPCAPWFSRAAAWLR